MNHRSLKTLHATIIACRTCPRLVAWREQVAREKVKRFAHEPYWGKPLPGFGDPHARLVIVGLAPAAHGGNRTGRVFTGDESGNWLFQTLHTAGFANQPTSTHRNDGLTLSDCYVTAAVHCAPPQNKPLPEEFQACSRYLDEEFQLLKNARVFVGLGMHGFNATLAALKRIGRISFQRRPAFGHGVMYRFDDLTMLGSYHPSQQNTFTGKLTRPMLLGVFRKARRLLDAADR